MIIPKRQKPFSSGLIKFDFLFEFILMYFDQNIEINILKQNHPIS